MLSILIEISTYNSMFMFSLLARRYVLSEIRRD